ncbi:hypothetical protein NMY22_g2106 [Coprinellus aureogranulatus]|nr:hypothetical protein NMY22_g2106 [Coprinellus aureogranulatus]
MLSTTRSAMSGYQIDDAHQQDVVTEYTLSIPLGTDMVDKSGFEKYRGPYSEKSEAFSRCFDLDRPVEPEGANLSLGERSLLSLARVLVRDSKIVILDEATASIDSKTDENVQKGIRQEFKDRTLLCIAHRIRTVLSYDRILVLDGGKIVELDTPLALFDKSGFFRDLCAGSHITRAEIANAKWVS